MEILIKESDDNLVIKIDADEFFGLIHSPFEEPFKEDGMVGGAVAFAELTIPRTTVRELVDTVTRLRLA